MLEGRIATTAGCLAARDLISWLIKELAGQEVADLVFDYEMKVLDQ